MIKDITKATTGMGEIVEGLPRQTHQVNILKMKSQASRLSWVCVKKFYKKVTLDIFREKMGN